ncbi:NUDIX domain-containing protein [Phragmitibacter flavus]|uniref:NUDIX domain-containing protein n=1 Tax=Phragmitibacter flavus TaxID=2576071 RepID=A0A5R8KGL4_9BACT|nr:NUDIX domain-containing protein [Phragmitibacter flavus]TLD71448.1 NUDIX domain-containing protein [Phragmitibacter flavus]
MPPPAPQPQGNTSPSSDTTHHLFVPYTPQVPLATPTRNLPHWQHPDATYFVTFRLADSLPAHLLAQWQQERKNWLSHHPEPWTGQTIAEYQTRFHETRETWLDQGHGSCTLRDPSLSNIVASALQHFHEDRYLLDQFVIMPNHAHLILKPLPGQSLSKILQSIKWFTAREINRALNRSGPFWMDESYDHIIRDWNELNRFRQYIQQNPEKARLNPSAYNLGTQQTLLQAVDSDLCDTGLQPVGEPGILPDAGPNASTPPFPPQAPHPAGSMPAPPTGSKPVSPPPCAPKICDTGLQPVGEPGILPGTNVSTTAPPPHTPRPAGSMPAPPTGSKPVSQVPTFPLCHIGDHGSWKKLPGEMVYNGRYVQIEECPFLTPARPTTPVDWTVAHRKSAIAVAPITEDGHFILIHQERLPVMRSLWEFPAGQIDEAETHEAILHTLHRELDEESGCELLPGGTITPLGWFFGSQGFTQEHVYLFTAHPVHQVREPQPVGDEHIGEVRLVTPAELREMVATGEIQDALTLALFARMAARGII